MDDASTLRDMHVHVDDTVVNTGRAMGYTQHTFDPDRPCSSRAAIAQNSSQEATSSSAAFNDDVCTLSFITRMRLANVLDTSEQWARVASALDCAHMIEFLRVVTDADGTQSPTALLLDQYEVRSCVCIRPTHSYVYSKCPVKRSVHCCVRSNSVSVRTRCAYWRRRVD
jgi:hypothetical protein